VSWIPRRVPDRRIDVLRWNSDHNKSGESNCSSRSIAMQVSICRIADIAYRRPMAASVRIRRLSRFGILSATMVSPLIRHGRSWQLLRNNVGDHRVAAVDVPLSKRSAPRLRCIALFASFTLRPDAPYRNTDSSQRSSTWRAVSPHRAPERSAFPIGESR